MQARRPAQELPPEASRSRRPLTLQQVERATTRRLAVPERPRKARTLRPEERSAPAEPTIGELTTRRWDEFDARGRITKLVLGPRFSVLSSQFSAFRCTPSGQIL